MEVEQAEVESVDTNLLFIQMLTEKLAEVESSGTRDLDMFNFLNRMLVEIHELLGHPYSAEEYFGPEHFSGSSDLLPEISPEMVSQLLNDPEKMAAVCRLIQDQETVPERLAIIDRRYNASSRDRAREVHYNPQTLQQNVARAPAYVPESTLDEDEDDFI